MADGCKLMYFIATRSVSVHFMLAKQIAVMHYIIDMQNKSIHFPMVIFTTIMASGRKRVRFTVDVALPSEAARIAFKGRLSSVRDLLTPPGQPKLDNLALMTALLDLAESRPSVISQPSQPGAQTGSFLPSSGT